MTDGLKIFDDWLQPYYDGLEPTEQAHVIRGAQEAVDLAGGVLEMELSMSITLKVYLYDQGVMREDTSSTGMTPSREQQCANGWWHD